jgi:hypothetical protein
VEERRQRLRLKDVIRMMVYTSGGFENGIMGDIICKVGDNTVQDLGGF